MADAYRYDYKPDIYRKSICHPPIINRIENSKINAPKNKMSHRYTVSLISFLPFEKAADIAEYHVRSDKICPKKKAKTPANPKP